MNAKQVVLVYMKEHQCVYRTVNRAIIPIEILIKNKILTKNFYPWYLKFVYYLYFKETTIKYPFVLFLYKLIL